MTIHLSVPELVVLSCLLGIGTFRAGQLTCRFWRWLHQPVTMEDVS